MFFIMGITDGQKELNYDSGGMNICKSCGAYSRYTVLMTYMCLSLLFIPTIRTIKRDIDYLKEMNVIKREGTAKAGKWIITVN